MAGSKGTQLGANGPGQKQTDRHCGWQACAAAAGKRRQAWQGAKGPSQKQTDRAKTKRTGTVGGRHALRRQPSAARQPTEQKDPCTNRWTGSGTGGLVLGVAGMRCGGS